MLSKVVQEIIKRGVTAARKKFGDEKVKKAHDKMQEEGFDFQDMVKGRGVFKDFTVKDIAKLDKYSAQQRRKVMKQKTREYKVGQAKKKFDKTVKNLENIPLSHVAGAGAAAAGAAAGSAAGAAEDAGDAEDARDAGAAMSESRRRVLPF